MRLLDLSETKITGSSLKLISEHLDLKTLTLADTDLHDEDVVFLASPDRRGCRNLKLLNLSNCRNLTKAVLLPILLSFPRLISLYMSGCLEKHGNLFAYCKKLPPEKCWKSLRSIFLSRCIDVDGLVLGLITRGARGSIETLMLSKCEKIDELSVENITKHCPNLLLLDLSECPLVSDNAVTMIALSCRKLESLTISYCSLVRNDSIKTLLSSSHCPFLRSLILSECPLVNDEALLDLENKKSLKQIALTGTSVTRKLALKMKSAIPDLNISMSMCRKTYTPRRS
eukprot:TRINITY_DN6759_c0_g1_i1.p1 TRINITY_DN6759_c0_g1~~TRINITY_DN6759_c0_g1_i1.p1  ORF type:complete len:285 (+),score=52.38 TRINITY_DN6759_c0_g1_i1:298-1152(+)